MRTEVIERLSEMLKGRKIVSKDELERHTLRALLEVVGLEIINIKREFVEEIVRSLIEYPITIKSPYYSEELKIEGITFYYPHTETPGDEDFKIAYTEYIKSKKLVGQLENLIQITDGFFQGYQNRGKIARLYTKNKFRYLVIYSIIDDLFNDFEVHKELKSNFSGEYVIVVPTEDDISKFYKFYKKRSEDAKRAEIKIWVANTIKNSINPFIGYPKDFKLIKGFENPKIATVIGSLWRVNVKDLD